MHLRNETSSQKFVLRAILFFFVSASNIFFVSDVVAQVSRDTAQKETTQIKSDSPANEGAILTSDQAARPELILKRERWKPVIWFLSGAAVALLIMYYTVRIFYRPTPKK